MLNIDYTNEVVKDVVLAGIHDADVRTGVLEMENITELSPKSSLIS